MPQFSRSILLDAALAVAHGKHFAQLTRDDVATQAGCSPGLVSRYFGTMADLRNDLVSLARRRGCLRAINAAPVAQVRNSGRNGPVRS